MTCSCEAMERALDDLRTQHAKQLVTQERVFGARIAELSAENAGYQKALADLSDGCVQLEAGMRDMQATIARVRELPERWRSEDCAPYYSCAFELEAALSGKVGAA